MKRIPLQNKAIALPLLGLLLVWALAMAAQYVSMMYEQGSQNTPKPSIYILLVGFMAAGAASLFGRIWALKADKTINPGLTRAAIRFSSLAVVVSLGALTIFAIGNFMSGFNDYARVGDVGYRFVWLYLPIILSTAAVVFLILRAFVFDHGKADAADGKPGLSERQKALALGYAAPILATAFAIILGLFIYDATRTNLQIWVWVIIVTIVGVGVILGTRFASKAKSARVEVAREQQVAAAGAASLNFVLSIVFGVTVSILAFANGSGAMDKLRDYEHSLQVEPWTVPVKPVTLQWFIEEMAPAKVLILIAVIGVYLSITERHRIRKQG